MQLAQIDGSWYFYIIDQQTRPNLIRPVDDPTYFQI